MNQNSFFSGCNYSNRDITTDASTGWSLCPVQDINKYGVDVNVDDTFSRWYCDLYLRQLKEALKHTMLEHESVFESQIHELHRLYRRQKELMMEMERTRHHKALYLNSGFSIPRSHWMCSSISAHQPHEGNIPTKIEAVDKVDKSEKKVLDLELPVFEYNDMNGEVHEAPYSLESSKQLNKLQLDLNEPAEHSDHVFNQLLSSVTSTEIGEESDPKNEGEDSVKGSHRMNEAPGSVKYGGAEHGIDLNMSPISFEEEVTIVNKFETEKPQESLSVSLHGKHRSEQFQVIVQALPCSNSILLLNRRGSRPRKKVKLGPSKGSALGSHSSGQATSGSHSNQASLEKGSSTSLSARNQSNLGKKRRCKPQMKSSNGENVVAKKKRKKSRRICLVTEGNYQEISAAETMVDLSRKSGGETSECINSSCRNLLWFAEISTSVDCFEAMTEKKLEEHKKILRLNSEDKETAVSSIGLGKQRRRRSRQGKRKCKDDQDDDKPSLGVFSECEANEDVQVIGKLIEVNWGAIKKQRRGARIPATDFQHMIIN